jgi:hypothetical protein
LPQNWREGIKEMANGNGLRIPVRVGGILTSLLAALVLFLSGWVWSMERRVTTLEIEKTHMERDIAEIKQGVTDIKQFLMGDNYIP